MKEDVYILNLNVNIFASLQRGLQELQKLRGLHFTKKILRFSTEEKSQEIFCAANNYESPDAHKQHRPKARAQLSTFCPQSI